MQQNAKGQVAEGTDLSKKKVQRSEPLYTGDCQNGEDDEDSKQNFSTSSGKQGNTKSKQRRECTYEVFAYEFCSCLSEIACLGRCNVTEKIKISTVKTVRDIVNFLCANDNNGRRHADLTDQLNQHCVSACNRMQKLT